MDPEFRSFGPVTVGFLNSIQQRQVHSGARSCQSMFRSSSLNKLVCCSF